jgi:hypothetical protein
VIAVARSEWGGDLARRRDPRPQAQSADELVQLRLVHRPAGLGDKQAPDRRVAAGGEVGVDRDGGQRRERVADEVAALDGRGDRPVPPVVPEVARAGAEDGRAPVGVGEHKPDDRRQTEPVRVGGCDEPVRLRTRQADGGGVVAVDVGPCSAPGRLL